jgi:hypothetical protein
MGLQKAEGLTRSVRCGIVKMEDHVSSPIFGSHCWTILIDLLQDILHSIKVLSFWQQLDERKTEWRPTNGEHAFRSIDCLPRSCWNQSFFGEPDMIMLDSEIKPGLVSCHNVAPTPMFR